MRQLSAPVTTALFYSACLVIILQCKNAVANDDNAHHAMYVWSDAFDVNAPHCEGVYPADKSNDNASCFRHSWATAEARERLWAACSSSSSSTTIVPTTNTNNRQVKRIFVGDVRNRIRHDGTGKNSDGDCDPELVDLLSEAHGRGIEVYGLFSVSDAAFSEQDMVGDLNLFNTHCGNNNNNSTAKDVHFDGASVNNEHFSTVKTCQQASNEVAQRTFLDNLSNTANNAAPLPLHFSIAWNWWCCSCQEGTERLLEWEGTTKNVVSHIIDTVDSVDVQVAWNVGSTMVRRSMEPYQYWHSTKHGQTPTTAFYVLAYTNPNSDCRLSFSPHVKGGTQVADTCSTGDRTEQGMFTAFDEIQTTLPNAAGAIHFMGGVYSSDMPGWPRHTIAEATGVTDTEKLTSSTSNSGAVSAAIVLLVLVYFLA